MARQADLTAINCTSCGAGLDILGGGRVTTHICPYCGSELDATAGYKALRKYTEMPRPDSPFKIGMVGQINGVEFTIIGTLGYAEGRWEWVDHQLYSPTHGYAWLTVEDGHITFTRRFRKEVHPGFITSNRVERAEHRPSAHAAGQRYEYYETSEPTLTFAEGEFTWSPMKGAKSTSVSTMSDNAMLTFVETENEREVEHSVYLDAEETLQAFGAPSVAPRGTHPLMPYREMRDEALRKKIFMAAAAASLVLLGLLLAGGNVVLPRTTFDASELPAEITFDLTRPGKLTRITFDADVSNSWAEMDVTVYDPQEEPLFETGRLVERYSGRDSEGSWTEGSGTASLVFRALTAGSYTIEVDLAAAGNWQRTGTPVSAVSVGAVEGVVAIRWLIYSSLLLGFGALAVTGRHWLHDRRRWAGSDWVEEDDD
ncbi:hypothetical protein ACMU_09420 [Actibacterium mucosum KCTC 23349]|uniref:DUF4178 domain-containing protein n=1 Tax=Actibacterium mucosum KCTC 23349 TaxID=1454373 RepID=A0A037ZIP8_9RHOB|nr:DUF4178 domain-containing protein [Actibacterium mucosum]KAJ55973.1 hypothetical protein ACMU_09420 [Actibacterium mucosum KCTC 23349]